MSEHLGRLVYYEINKRHIYILIQLTNARVKDSDGCVYPFFIIARTEARVEKVPAVELTAPFFANESG
jgi:hypothetical protein